MKKILTMTTLLFFGLGIHMASGQAESQWRGPNRDGVYPGESLIKVWPEAGPEEIWSVGDLGDGYSSAAVTADRVYLTGMTKGEGFLYAFDLEGKPVWKASYGPEWNGSRPGARTTPTVVGIDADTGEYLWRHSHVTDYSVNANTPLYHNGFIYVYSGYGTGGQMFQPNSQDFELVSSYRVKKGSGEHWAHHVIKDGRLYIRHGDALMVYQIGDE